MATRGSCWHLLIPFLLDFSFDQCVFFLCLAYSLLYFICSCNRSSGLSRDKIRNCKPVKCWEGLFCKGKFLHAQITSLYKYRAIHVKYACICCQTIKRFEDFAWSTWMSLLPRMTWSRDDQTTEKVEEGRRGLKPATTVVIRHCRRISAQIFQ